MFMMYASKIFQRFNHTLHLSTIYKMNYHLPHAFATLLYKIICVLILKLAKKPRLHPNESLYSFLKDAPLPESPYRVC